MSIFKKLFKKQEQTEEVLPKDSAPDAKSVLNENLMIVQLAEYYIEYGDEIYKQAYLKRTEDLGITAEEALGFFRFECDVCRKFNKKYFLDSSFVKTWFMGLQQPFFVGYPKTKDEICGELFLSIGELCKLMDEAEWHFWNNHERELPNEVWEEICEWRIRGKGGMYAVEDYLPAVCRKYAVTMDSARKIVNHYGAFLNSCKWS